MKWTLKETTCISCAGVTDKPHKKLAFFVLYFTNENAYEQRIKAEDLIRYSTYQNNTERLLFVMQ